MQVWPIFLHAMHLPSHAVKIQEDVMSPMIISGRDFRSMDIADQV